MPPAPPPALAQALRLHQVGRFAEAVALYEKALRSRPGQPAALVQLGLALRSLGRNDDALAAFARAQTVDPKFAEAFHQSGNLLKRLGRLPDALAALRTAAQLAPTHAATLLNLGAACLDAGLAVEAAVALGHAVALEPTRPEAQNILGVALLAAGEFLDARASFDEALRLRPGYAAAHDNLGRLCKAEGRLAEAIPHYRAALAAKPDPNTHSNLLFALNCVADLAPGEIFAEHRRWHQLYAAPLAPATPPAPLARPPGRRLRIGYVSPDFTHHAVGYFIEPVLAAHDRARVEIFCYASVAAPDRFTERMRGLAEHWRDIAPLNDEAAAALIRADEIDLLVDLAGHTAKNRLLLFARRPAPAQATWIGYPNTTGLDAIDYRLTDAISDPPGTTEAFCSERLVRLPTTFSCYGPDDDAPTVNPLPATDSNKVTFGCFNSFAKVTPAVITVWSRILEALPEARLLLKSRGLNDLSVAARLHAAFSAAGITPDRIVLNGDELSVAAHLGLYHGVDIALDPFPYNGTTTTCEALWMGVPVVTLAGRTHVARVGASLLTHTGLTNWIAASPDDYVERAVAAARDLPRLAELRRTLRERLRASPLCDASRFTRGLEEAYEAMTTK